MNLSSLQSGPIIGIFLLAVILLWGCLGPTDPLSELESPIVFHGDDSLAYRDPAVLYHKKTFYLFFTLTETEPNDSLFWYTAVSKSRDLKHWTKPERITPRDQHLNFSSPGNVVRYGDKWSEPELLNVKGNHVARKDMGRMIDPYLIEDKDEAGRWWCFYKQNGVSYSWSHDLVNWTFSGYTLSGENVCVLIEQDEYLLFHSPQNGIGVKRPP
jgi:hypothetical protein